VREEERRHPQGAQGEVHHRRCARVAPSADDSRNSRGRSRGARPTMSSPLPPRSRP
jgi:hypothetical protein